MVTRRRALGAAGAAALVGVVGYAASRPFRRRSAQRAAGASAGVRAGAGAGAGVGRLAAAPAGIDDELDLPADVLHHYLEVRDGGRIHVVERGSGPVVLLIHGANLAAALWAYQFHDLASGYRLVALELRGHGESKCGSEGVTITAMADDVAEVLTSLDLASVLVVGHSMGGMTVLRLARRHPALVAERVSAVLLLSTAAGVVPNIGPWARVAPMAGMAAVAAGTLAARSGRLGLGEGEVGRRLARLGFGLAPPTAQLDAVLRMMRSGEPNRFFAIVPELVAFDERAVFEDLPIPVTVVVGDRDRLTPPALARELADAIGGARLVVWPGAGHMLMYERRESLDWLIGRMASAAQEAAEPDR
jgi:pimeloyl-ACP methyl ester carboxylesterase